MKKFLILITILAALILVIIFVPKIIHSPDQGASLLRATEKISSIKEGAQPEPAGTSALIPAQSTCPASGYKFVTKWSLPTQPFGIATDSGGNVYVVEQNNDLIKKFDSQGNLLTQWGGHGSANGQFDLPTYITIDASNNVYVVDFLNYRIQKFNSNGAFITKWGSFGTGNGQFSSYGGITVDPQGNLYILDYHGPNSATPGNARIQKFTSSGAYLSQWNLSTTGAWSMNGQSEILADATGLYVVDGSANKVKKFSSSGTLVAQWGSYGTGNGQLNNAWAIEKDALGNIYIGEGLGQGTSHRIQKFSPAGNYITQWGSLGSGNGQFEVIYDMAIDGQGNVYVSDMGNKRIQKFAPCTPLIIISHPNTPPGPIGTTVPPVTNAPRNPSTSQACVTTGAGTDTVTLDPGSPSSTTIARGSTNVEFARITIKNTGNTLLCYNGIQVGSMSNLNNYITNVRVIDLVTGEPFGQVTNNFSLNSSQQYYNWKYPSPHAWGIISGGSRTFKFVADVPINASTGSMNLGLTGINHTSPGASGFYGTPVLGATMQIQ